MPKLRFDQYLVVLIVALTIVIQPDGVELAKAESIQIFSPPSYTLIDPGLVPMAKLPPEQLEAGSRSFLQTLSAQGVLVMDLPSATILLAKNADTLLYPASTTKMMTALVAREQYDLEEIVTISEESFTLGNTMGLKKGEQIRVKDLLSGLLISSGNDAAFALANHHPGGYEGFVAAMNTKAEELHLESAHFTNPSGLDDTSHQLDPRDLGLIAKEFLTDPLLKAISGTSQVMITDVSGDITHPLRHTHALITTDDRFTGGKTGTTDLAGEVLVSLVEAEGKQLIIIVMGSHDRYEETLRVYNWTQTNFEWRGLSDFGYDE